MLYDSDPGKRMVVGRRFEPMVACLRLPMTYDTNPPVHVSLLLDSAELVLPAGTARALAEAQASVLLHHQQFSHLFAAAAHAHASPQRSKGGGALWCVECGGV